MSTVIDVCVCTFRRPAVALTIESLAAQTGAPAFRVIVVDNDETPSAKAAVEAASATTGLSVRYVHAPAGNISVARNACLDASSAPFVAFIDDDETAPSHWLKALAEAVERLDCDVVFGPVKASYPEDAPEWVRRGDFHSTGVRMRDGDEVLSGYSGNVLFKRALAGDLRFDLELGRSGGEDTMFFELMRRRGAKLRFCADAELREPVPRSRITLSWLLRRSFRAGQTHARLLAGRGRSGLHVATMALAKASYCAGAALLTIWSQVEFRRSLIRGALHVGAAAKALGVRDAHLYGRG